MQGKIYRRNTANKPIKKRRRHLLEQMTNRQQGVHYMYISSSRISLGISAALVALQLKGLIESISP
jgi:hypothetical protein